ncbi:hypothetical protein [Methylotenera sp.]
MEVALKKAGILILVGLGAFEVTRRVSRSRCNRSTGTEI